MKDIKPHIQEALKTTSYIKPKKIKNEHIIKEWKNQKQRKIMKRS